MEATMADGMQISDDILWGKLVKSWATGQSYSPVAGPAPVPRTLAELHQQCQAIGLAITFPPAQKGLAVVQYSSDVVVLKLPPKDMVLATEAALGQPGATYPIPAFYDAFYGHQVNVPANRLLDFHAARIGDYSIRNCG
jgi:hypothetical protein